MDGFDVGKLLPNLNISITNDNIVSDSSGITHTNMPSVASKVEVVCPSVGNHQENSGVLNQRADRFGIDSDDARPSFTSLYESMGINIKHWDSAQMMSICLKSLHVRGVQELSSREVFNYFRGYGPASLEWLNDFSCNLIWFDETGPARALIGLSKPLPAQFPLTDFINSSKKIETLDLSSLDLNDDKEKNKMEIDDSSAHESQLIDIAIPPGQWRLGLPHSKAKTILLRFATRDDQKSPNAEKRSKYNQKFENPNYGGLKSLISSSRKHEVQVVASRLAIKRGSTFSYKSFINHDSDTFVPKIRKKKAIRMRMYADDEEDKRSRSGNYMKERKGSVHSRLGAKHTADDLCLLGTYRDWDKDSSYTRTYESDSFKPNPSTSDLRSKLKRSRYYNKQTYGGMFSRRYDEAREYEESAGKEYQESANIKRYRRVDDLKKESRSFFKRKHRSPLCADDDDDDSETSSD